jgi:hypothetical protein
MESKTNDVECFYAQLGSCFICKRKRAFGEKLCSLILIESNKYFLSKNRWQPLYNFEAFEFSQTRNFFLNITQRFNWTHKKFLHPYIKKAHRILSEIYCINHKSLSANEKIDTTRGFSTACVKYKYIPNAYIYVLPYVQRV